MGGEGSGDEHLRRSIKAHLDRNPESLVSVTGPPGVGKTIFAANWFHDGARRFGERGIYVSFAESYSSFLNNMRSLGFRL